MNEREAIMIIQAIPEKIWNQMDKVEEQAISMAVKELEKQISKKPLVWEDKYYDSPIPNDNWGYECPCCGNKDIDYPDHHCTCGQALDWEFEYRGEL